MNRSGVVFSIIVCILFLTIHARVPVFAADGAMENLLPAYGCAQGWTLKDKATLFDKDTLFDHINGEAELYFPYGFDVLATATYVNGNNSEVWIVADVYRMASPLDAFGIYSNYRKADAASITVGAEGFVSSSQLMFYQDRYFVRLQVTGATSLEQDVFLACARSVSEKLPSNARPAGELEALKIPGIVPKTERYIAKSLLGYAFFRRGIIADALLEGERAQVFMVLEDSVAAAREAFDQYRSYMKAEGKNMQLQEWRDYVTMVAVDPLYGGVFVEQSGRYIIGAVRLKEPSSATKLIEQLRERLGGGKS
ncbi:MAG: DUF6599 family protein [Syntrophales bacterium]|jgi:hypothetical protein